MSSPTLNASGRLYAVDAHAYLHRAYHALPPLTNSSGEPVGALYGFARMLLGLLRREKPEFAAVCFDAPGPTFRHQAYERYKATRKEIDEDLRKQLALARPLAEAMGLRCIEAPGFEADDLLATLATRAVGRGVEVTLVTTDKDAFQLVEDGKVRVLHEGKGLVFDAGKVAEKFGVGPERITDYLALVGDASDNVPGVPGIGPVGAAKLLNRYGSLDALLRAAAAGDKGLAPKAAQALKESREQALKSRELVTLRREAPLGAELADCRAGPVDKEKLRPLLQRFEFHSLLRELLPEEGAAGPGRASRAAISPAEGEPPLDLKRWLEAARGAKRVALAHCRAGEAGAGGAAPSLALSLPDGRTAWAEPADWERHGPALTRLLGPGCEKAGHDLKSLWVALAPLHDGGVVAPRFDTFLAAYALNPARPSYEFEALLGQYGGGDASARPGRDASPEELRARALRRARGLWPLADRLREELEKGGFLKLYEELELPLVDALAGMELAGVRVDRAHLEALRAEFEARARAAQREIDSLAKAAVNPNSPKQLAKLLFEDLGLPVVHKTPKGGVSTDEETLRALAGQHPLPAKILEYRELSKLRSTYIEVLLERMDPRTQRVHTRFNQAGTTTGRISSLEPNLQNIPIRTQLGQKIRRAFVAEKGCVLLSADYSQIDLRVLAHLSGDPALGEAFREGRDVHLQTACEVFGAEPGRVDAEMRRRAKAVNFGIVYGQTAHGLAQELGIPFPKAKEYIERYFERYAGVKAWSQGCLESARREGVVRTLFGRARPLPDILARNTALRQFNERVAVNTPIQGSSADIIKAAMASIHRGMTGKAGRWKSRLLLQVHDELLFECPRKEAAAFGAWARGEMESAAKLRVPLVVDLKSGPNWQDMEPLEAGR